MTKQQKAIAAYLKAEKMRVAAQKAKDKAWKHASKAIDAIEKAGVISKDWNFFIDRKCQRSPIGHCVMITGRGPDGDQICQFCGREQYAR